MFEWITQNWCGCCSLYFLLLVIANAFLAGAKKPDKVMRDYWRNHDR